MEKFKKIEIQKINNNMEELLIVIQEQNKILQDTIIYFNEKRNNNEIQSISKPIFNKTNGNKKLISLRMLNEDTNNRLKEQLDTNEYSKIDEEEDIFIYLQDIKTRTEHLKTNESKPRIYKQGKWK